MDTVKIFDTKSIGKNFIPQEFLVDGTDEYYFRNKQTLWSQNRWRHLNSEEVEMLVKNNNSSSNWDDILVTDQFDPSLIINSEFFGLIRIGFVSRAILQHHDLSVPVGITNSVIISCDIGDNTAIHNVRYLSHYIIGDRNILFNIDEMHTTNHSKFGNGIIKEGESENVRIWLELINETGSRKVLPFDGMIPADAYLWAKYRDDDALQKELITITQNRYDEHRGYYGTTSDQCVIKNSRILKDTKVGEHAYIKGANKLKNLTINSSEEEPTQIGEGCELVNGIVGYGCHIFYGCKAVRFIVGNNSKLKYGARVINSFLGDNSTISCCEVLHNLIFPAHEQHHNNSFLTASLIMGQSNMAAGVTIGSNHNSRANDNEIQAGRGFWPGLCTSVKHSSRFASFVLLSKADYPSELDVRIPFSLLNNNTAMDHLEVIPAFWWLYNMYALARNSWKFQTRDNRKNKIQNIEFDSLAPDIIEEIIDARRLLEIWTAKAYLRKIGDSINKKDDDLQKIGYKLLSSTENKINGLEIIGENMEKSKRKVVILKTFIAYQAYGEMLHYYAVKNLLVYMKANSKATYSSLCENLHCNREKKWVNFGGQLIPEKDVKVLRAEIGSRTLSSWEDIHQRYDDLWKQYPLEKQKHAYATLCYISGQNKLSKEEWISALNKAVTIQKYICEQVYITRKKDFDSPFLKSTYRNAAEMEASIGTIEDNSFVKQVRKKTEEFEKMVAKIITRT